MLLHITFFTEFPYTKEILEHALLDNEIGEFVARGSVGQISLVLSEEDRYYALKIIMNMEELGLIGRVRIRSLEEGQGERF